MSGAAPGNGPFVGVVPESLAGVRVDRAVAFLTGVSRAVASDLVTAGKVRLGGRPVEDRRAPLVAGADLVVTLPGPVRAAVVPDPTVEVAVVHEDPHFVVVDKAPGVVVHPGAGHQGGTLVAGLLARYPDLAALGAASDPARPGIVHRLDRPTSGLLVVARTAEAYRSLSSQMAARTVGRRYLALVAGHLADDRGLIDAPVGRSARVPTRMAVSAHGRPARTTYQVLARLDALGGPGGPASRPYAATLVACALETGRTHQIRVHMAAIGHPVVGDDRYGRAGARILAPGRLFLHAAELSFDHPASGARVGWDSALPPDLVAVSGPVPPVAGSGGSRPA